MKNILLKCVLTIYTASTVFGFTFQRQKRTEEQSESRHFHFEDAVTHLRRQTTAFFKYDRASRPKRVTVTQLEGTPLSDDEICGRPRVLTTKIVGGKEVPKGVYPWMAALIYFDADNNTLVGCGGTVITKRIILTAAHCLRTRRINIPAMPDEIYVGVSKLSGPDRIALNTLAGVSHKKYNKNTKDNDIALIVMEDPIIFNAYVLPICLPTPELKSANLDRRKVQTAGWGYTSSAGFQSEVLLDVTIDVIPEDECKNDYKGDPNIVIDERIICAIDKVKKLDSCQGDSGGPLMLLWGGRYYVIGVVSRGDTVCGFGRPGIYTSVPYHLNWITNKIAEINSNFEE